MQFAGKIVPPTMDAWVGDRSSWIEISYVNGLTIDASGEINIDGYGSTWWEKCRSCQRPTVGYNITLSFVLQQLFFLYNNTPEKLNLNLNNYYFF